MGPAGVASHSSQWGAHKTDKATRSPNRKLDYIWAIRHGNFAYELITQHCLHGLVSHRPGVQGATQGFQKVAIVMRNWGLSEYQNAYKSYLGMIDELCPEVVLFDPFLCVRLPKLELLYYGLCLLRMRLSRFIPMLRYCRRIPRI